MTDWRWGFYLLACPQVVSLSYNTNSQHSNLVVGGVCAPVYIFLLPTLNPRSGQSKIKRALELDYLGILMLCGIITSITMAISFGGVEFVWNSGQIIALFIVAFVLLLLFLGQQILAIGTTAERRVFPLRFLQSSTMIVLFIEVACAATCVFVPVYFLPLYFQFVKGDSAITAGVRMIPFVVFQTVIALFSGWLVGKTGYYVPWYIFSGAFCIAGSGLLYTLNQYTPLANVYGYEILLGLGSAASTQLSFTVASIKVASVDIPRSTGWEAFAQLGGPTIALSIANSVFLNKAQEGILALLPNLNVLDVSTIISNPGSPLLRDLPQNVQDQVVDVIVRSMINAFILCIIGGSLILLLALRFKINSKLFDQPAITSS